MSNWCEKNLGELGYTYTGLSGKNASDFGEGKPYIPYMNIFANGRINVRNLEYVKINQHEKQNTVKQGDLFFTTSSETFEEVGMTSVLLEDIEECYLNSFCFGFRLYNFDDLLPEFVPYLFRGIQVRKNISILGQGSTRYNLPKTQLLNRLFLNLPPLPTQRKISQILSTADAVIEKTQAAIAKYKAIKQGMLRDMFTRGIDINSGKLRPTFEDAPELYKESKLGWIPKEWEIDEFQSVCDFITDGSHYSPTPIEDGKIIANVKDMGEYGINYETCTKISVEEFNLLRKQNCSPNIGDVLLSKDGTIGRVVLFMDNREIIILSSIAILRPSKLINSEYLCSFLKSEYFDKQLLIKTSGSALKRIVLRDINTLLLVFPIDKKEQEIISKRIIQIESKLQTEQNYLHKLQQIKAGLMADLLSGKKKVKI